MQHIEIRASGRTTHLCLEGRHSTADVAHLIRDLQNDRAALLAVLREMVHPTHAWSVDEVRAWNARAAAVIAKVGP